MLFLVKKGGQHEGKNWVRCNDSAGELASRLLFNIGWKVEYIPNQIALPGSCGQSVATERKPSLMVSREHVS